MDCGENLQNLQEERLTSWLEALNYEFEYFCYVLKKLTDNLNNSKDIGELLPWIKKLFTNEYGVQALKEIRNRYLLYLTLSLINKETYPMFKRLPPEGPLGSVDNLSFPKSCLAEWEIDTTWNDICKVMQDTPKPIKCSIHTDFMKCQEIVEINKVLDEEFQFMIYLATPLLSKWPISNDRKKAGHWIQILCTVHYNCFCSNMRVIRNEYLMALLGYLYDGKLNGPFENNPPTDILYPLQKMTMQYIMDIQANILNPKSNVVNDFLVDQPIPKEGGAFCYIAITGPLLKGKIGTSTKCDCSFECG